MTTFFEHQKASYKKNYLRTLISLASSDGLLDESEKILIVKIGKSKGLKDWQIDNLLSSEPLDENTFLPESMDNRMDLIFDYMQIIYADGNISKSEMEFIKSLVLNFNLRPEIVDHLIDLFQYGTPARDDWKEFVQHASEVFVN